MILKYSTFYPSIIDRNYRVLMSVCVSACVSFRLSVFSVCVHDNSKNNGSIHLKLEHFVVFENSSDEEVVIKYVC